MTMPKEYYSAIKDILVFVLNGGNQRTQIPCTVTHVGAKNTGLAGTESREETPERREMGERGVW